MCLAKAHDVDMVLLGGDLFHDNKPSRKSMYNVMRSMRLNCLGDKPCELEMLSDETEHFLSSPSTAIMTTQREMVIILRWIYSPSQDWSIISEGFPRATTLSSNLSLSRKVGRSWHSTVSPTSEMSVCTKPFDNRRSNFIALEPTKKSGTI
jgi:hypothetical protein